MFARSLDNMLWVTSYQHPTGTIQLTRKELIDISLKHAKYSVTWKIISAESGVVVLTGSLWRIVCSDI